MTNIGILLYTLLVYTLGGIVTWVKLKKDPFVSAKLLIFIIRPILASVFWPWLWIEIGLHYIRFRKENKDKFTY